MMNIIKAGASILMLVGVSLPTVAASVGELSGRAMVSQGKSGYQVDLQLPSGVNDLVPALSVQYQQGTAKWSVRAWNELEWVIEYNAL